MKITINEKGKEPFNVKFIEFPSAERMPVLPFHELPKSFTIIQSIQSPEDLFDIAQTADALRRARATEIHLLAPYIMGARQDRQCNKGEPLTAKVVASFINLLDFKSVTTLYPHSDVLPALINNCYADDDITSMMMTALMRTKAEEVIIIAPDAGATKRVFKNTQALQAIKTDLPHTFVQATKKRDTQTGAISGFEVEYDKFNDKQQILVVDDICANGGTFIGLSKILAEKGASNMKILTIHADCIRGLENISPHYTGGVYTTDSRIIDETTDENIKKFIL